MMPRSIVYEMIIYFVTPPFAYWSQGIYFNVYDEFNVYYVSPPKQRHEAGFDTLHPMCAYVVKRRAEHRISL
jgi:hypothetical protein